MSATLKALMDEFGGYIEYNNFGKADETRKYVPGLLTEDKAIPADAPIVDIASGGLQKRGAQPPALCDDPDLALQLWGETARDFARSKPAGTRFKWVETPTLDRWQITITDARFTHRLTSDRYAVFARILVAPPK